MPIIIGCDLDWQFYTLPNVFNEIPARPVITFPDLVRQNKFAVRVNARPKPVIAFARYFLDHPASMAANKIAIAHLAQVADKADRESFRPCMTRTLRQSLE